MRTRWLVMMVLGQVACGGSEFSDTGGAAGAAGQATGAAGAGGQAGASTAGSAGAPGGTAGAPGAGAGGASSGSAGAPAGAAGSPGGNAGAPGGAAGATGGSAGAASGAAGAPGGGGGASGAGAGATAGSGGATAGSGGATAGSGGATAGSGGATAGSGGATACACLPGSYCRADTGTCATCSDLGRLEFGDPVRIGAVSAPGGDLEGHQRFPRPMPAGALVYRTGKWDKEKGLSYAVAPDASPGLPIGGTVDASGKSESGPWFLTKKVAALGDTTTLLFDRTVGGIGTDRQLMAAVWAPGTPPIMTPVKLPGEPNASGSNYSLAVAEDSGRIFWMSTRNNATRLLTMLPPKSSTQVDAVEIVLPSGCHRAGNDATPWVTPDGLLMLFRSLDVTPSSSCSPSVDSNDLFAVPLDVDGQPAGASLRIVTSPADETDPALSADLCTLYFAREDGDPAGGVEFNVYRAPRQ